MKILRAKLPLSILLIVISATAFTGIMFMEDLRVLNGISLFKFKACPSKVSKEEIEKANSAFNDDTVDEDKIDFDPNECDVTKGKWVFNNSVEALYSDETCAYLDKQVSCLKNGRPDNDFLYWEWQLDDCNLPRFDAVAVLEKLRGKRLMFVGDSLQRGQWQSLVCLVQSHIPPEGKSMNRSRTLSIFRAKEYNATIELYWAPFLIESNTDLDIITDPSKRILKVDSVSRHAQHWIGVDILVFNTYVWWTSDPRIKSLWGSFANGMEGFEELDALISYRLGIKTWANWIDSNVNPNTTRVFFTTMSPTHMRSADWNHKNGTRCYNETRPVTRRGYWGSGSNKRMMEVVFSVVGRMKVPVTFINITQLSEYRIDGHVSVYTESMGEVLTDVQKANPQKYADCIHWCLPGIPDTWNKIFYTYL